MDAYRTTRHPAVVAVVSLLLLHCWANRPSVVLISTPQRVGSVLCTGRIVTSRSGWVRCQAAEDIVLGNQTIPRGSTIRFDPAVNPPRIHWALERDTTIQGHRCKAGADWGAGFHANGMLRSCGLVETERIDGVLCAKAGFTKPTYFHENGRLRSCQLAQRTTIGACSFAKGEIAVFAADGQPVCSRWLSD